LPNSSASSRSETSSSASGGPGTQVAVKRRRTRTYNHPVVGEITLDWDPLTSEVDPDQQLIIYTAESGSGSEHALPELTAWATENIGQHLTERRPPQSNSPSACGICAG
jgi:hypothetical protein